MSSDDPNLPHISEFRRRALALAAVKDTKERTKFLEMAVELARELDAIRGELRELKVKQGTLGSRAAAQAAATVTMLLEPLEQKLTTFVDEVRSLAADVAELRELTVGEGDEDG